MTGIPLTRTEKRFYDALVRLCGADTAPSYDELAREIGLTSKSGVHRLVNQLESKGWITRAPNRARTIQIVSSCDLKAQIRALVRVHGRKAVASALEAVAS